MSTTAAMWENLDVLPRAFLVYQAEIADDQMVLARLRDPDFRPDQVVLLSDVTRLNLKNHSVTGEAKNQVLISEYKAERVIVHVSTDTMGYLVLTDSWYPGWIASVDGIPVPIYRAYYIFRAVPVEPGTHTVVFEYRPLSFYWGMLLSGISVVICLIASVIGYFVWDRS
jgi:uncharacterized membrane protein YfhO